MAGRLFHKLLNLCVVCSVAVLPVLAAGEKKNNIEVLKVREEADPAAERRNPGGETKRFVNNGDGTVLDKNTGLIWFSDANIARTAMPLQAAKQYIKEMNEGKQSNAGQTGWRLPTVKELEILVDKSMYYPSLPSGHPFQNVQNDFYWSGTESTDIVDNTWIMDLASGNVLLESSSYCNFRYLWPVRNSVTQEVKSGNVLASGLNEHGQLGSGTTEEEREVFLAVSGLSDVINIASGAEHAAALKNDGTVWTWGRNAEGQLGDGTLDDRNIPVMIKGIWNVKDIAAGMYHTVALRSDGTVWTWGRNYYGQLGDGTIEDRKQPVQIKMLSGVVRIFAGMYHTFALKADGTVWAWGWNNYGQLGDGSSIDSRTPIQIDSISDVASIAAGIHHTVALKSDGTVWAWGWNNYGLLGTEEGAAGNKPVQVKGLSQIVDVSAGMYHTVALKSDGTVWAWGKNEYGQLGTSSIKGTLASSVEGIGGVSKVAAGMYHTVALKSDGTIWVWGQEMKGKKEKNSPVLKRDLKGDFITVSAGKYYTLALSSSSTSSPVK